MFCALHGFLGKPTDWTELLRDSPISGNLHAIDLSRPLLDLEEWGKHFNSVVKSEEKSPNILMGYSLGGRLALHALIQQPDLWDAAIIISAHLGLESEEAKQQRKLSDEHWAKRFETESWDSLIKAWNQQALFNNDSYFERKEMDYDRAILADFIRIWSLANQTYLLPNLNALKMPILWIAGEKDFSYAEQAKKLVLQHPQSRVWIAPEAGHRVPWQKPKQFLETLNYFITDL